MKIPIELWKNYLASWPDDYWYDDDDATVNGVPLDDALPVQTDVVIITCGIVYAGPTDKVGVPLLKHFNKWNRNQSTIIMTVAIPKETASKLTDYVLQLEGKVLV